MSTWAVEWSATRHSCLGLKRGTPRSFCIKSGALTVGSSRAEQPMRAAVHLRPKRKADVLACWIFSSVCIPAHLCLFLSTHPPTHTTCTRTNLHLRSLTIRHAHLTCAYPPYSPSHPLPESVRANDTHTYTKKSKRQKPVQRLLKLIKKSFPLVFASLFTVLLR